MLDAFVDAGGNFVDTADTYGDGASERTLAPWLSRHRDDVVVATKLRFSVSDPGGDGLAPDRIVKACDASLRRLGIDVIDLYQVHAPDPAVVLDESLEALDGLVRAGKVRALGALRLAAAAVLARRALGRARAAAVLPVGGSGRPPLGPARRRLPHRSLRTRSRAAAREPDGRRRRRP